MFVEDFGLQIQTHRWQTFLLGTCSARISEMLISDVTPDLRFWWGGAGVQQLYERAAEVPGSRERPGRFWGQLRRSEWSVRPFFKLDDWPVSHRWFLWRVRIFPMMDDINVDWSKSKAMSSKPAIPGLIVSIAPSQKNSWCSGTPVELPTAESPWSHHAMPIAVQVIPQSCRTSLLGSSSRRPSHGTGDRWRATSRLDITYVTYVTAMMV